MTQNMFNQHAINCRALLIDKLVMNPGLSYVRITTSYMKYRAENHVITASIVNDKENSVSTLNENVLNFTTQQHIHKSYICLYVR